MNTREEMLRKRREELPLDARKVEALEMIADALTSIQGTLVQLSSNQRS